MGHLRSCICYFLISWLIWIGKWFLKAGCIRDILKCMILPYFFHLKACFQRLWGLSINYAWECVWRGSKGWKISLPRVLTSICTKLKRCDAQDVLDQLSFSELLHDDVSLFNWKQKLMAESFCARQMISLLKSISGRGGALLWRIKFA